MAKTYTQEEWQIERDERNKNWTLYQSSLRDVEDYKGKNLELNQRIKELESKPNDLVIFGEAYGVKKEENESLIDYSHKVAEKLSQSPTEELGALAYISLAFKAITEGRWN